MRVFAALPLPNESKQQVYSILRELGRRAPRLSLVRPEGLHVTVHFFGEVSDARVADLLDTVRACEFGNCRFKANASGISQFPQYGVPRVLYVRLDDRGRFIEVVQRFRNVARQCGFSVDSKSRGLIPHITVARNRKRSPVGPRELSIPWEPFEVLFDRLVIYRSILMRNGPRYEPLHTACLPIGD